MTLTMSGGESSGTMHSCVCGNTDISQLMFTLSGN